MYFTKFKSADFVKWRKNEG